eukprot:TRINITY_DN977_c0_g2_i10.p2 TRINITY_DN977_c0_g2~~TRINITY_DN977_c0_g2_i10.p2  ORF type:complete len:145 (+),score=13.33 TRINITY_DN977_c0_g2_i10:543-977(+)
MSESRGKCVTFEALNFCRSCKAIRKPDSPKHVCSALAGNRHVAPANTRSSRPSSRGGKTPVRPSPTTLQNFVSLATQETLEPNSRQGDKKEDESERKKTKKQRRKEYHQRKRKQKKQRRQTGCQPANHQPEATKATQPNTQEKL